MYFRSAAAIALAYSFLSLASAKVYTVTVGKDNGDVYDPPFLNATVDDLISFSVDAGTHSITESKSRDTPCEEKSGGQDSGSLKMNGSWNMTVKDSQPFWFYCKISNHCKNGMVFALNVNNETFKAFQAKAKASDSSSNSSGSGTTKSPSPTSSGGLSLSSSNSSLSPNQSSADVKVSIQKSIVALAVAVPFVHLSL